MAMEWPDLFPLFYDQNWIFSQNMVLYIARPFTLGNCAKNHLSQLNVKLFCGHCLVVMNQNYQGGSGANRLT